MGCRDAVVFELGLNFLADKNLMSFLCLGPERQSCRAQLILPGLWGFDLLSAAPRFQNGTKS